MEQSAVEKTRIVPFSCIEIFHKSTFSCSFFSFSFSLVKWSGVASLLAYGKRQGDGISGIPYVVLRFLFLLVLFACTNVISSFSRTENSRSTHFMLLLHIVLL